MNKNFILLATALLFSSLSKAQIFFADGATIEVTAGAVVISNGGVELTNSTSFNNDGTITITKNSTFPTPGNFEINVNTTSSGDGLLRVEQDFINDATFNGGNGEVELFGDTEQFITSTNSTVTTFNDLTLTGTGVGSNNRKTLLNVDANVGTNGILSINDRELATETNTFFVLNPATTAVTNTTTFGSEGFVSSLAPGTFSRETNSTGVYVFPTGSSVGTVRYRPIEVTPTAATANTYTVRMINNDATLDGFDRSVNDGVMCVLNGIYYHAIQRSAGATSADIRMHYVNATDGSWSGMGHWRTTNTQWNDMSTMTLGVSGGFNTVTRSAWLFANPGDPYILTTPAPAAPSISCPILCENSSDNLFTVTGTGSSYNWTVPGNGTISSGQGNDSLLVNWTIGTGYVSVTAVDIATGCISMPDSCQPSVLPAPTAAFTSTSVDGFDPNHEFFDLYTFTDQSTGASTWDWYFGDGNTSSNQNPINVYTTTGFYNVSLVVTNAAGCSDSINVEVPVGGILVPNVFSPNGDLTNDGFGILTSGLSEYKLSVYDRWGLLMFESTDVNTFWDGKTLDGKECPEGTYYFILKANSEIEDWSTSGHVTLIRN